MPKPGVIALVGLWLIMGVLGYLDGRAKAKGGAKDVTSSPIFIVAWPFMMAILGPIYVALLFLPVFGIAWLIDFGGAKIGLPYLGDVLVVVMLVTLACVTRVRARIRKREMHNEKA